MKSELETVSKSQRTSRWSFIIPVTLAAVLLVLAFRGVDWVKLLSTLAQGRLDYLALAFLFLSFSFFLRGQRWRVLLSAEQTVPRITMFWATSVGYLGNSFLPARAGEILRSVMVGRVSSIRKSYALATALTERILDVPVVIVMSLIALMMLQDMPAWLMQAVQAMSVLAIVGIAGLFIAPRMVHIFTRLLNWMPFLPHTLRERLIEVMEQFLLGMRAFQHPERGLSFLLFTIVIWSGDVVIANTIALALNLTLGMPQAMLLLAALGLSSAAPSTPGYVGIYQFVAVTVLTPFGFLQSEALAYILAFQAVTYLVVTVWGFIGLWRMSLVKPAAAPLPQEHEGH